MNWLHYLLEANLYLAVFYAGYYLLLSRETYYTLTRAYLLFSCMASFALPVIQLGILKPVQQPVTAVQFAFTTQATTFIPIHTAPVATSFTWQDGIVAVYLLGAAVLFLVFLTKLYQLIRLTKVKNMGSDGRYKLVYIDQSDTAFSFFNYLFIGTKVQHADMIIKHELVHIRQKHSADIIFIELLKIVNWFNPFIYLLQYSLKEIHEYIADEKTATSGTDTLAYSSFLVNNAYGLSGSSITHSFFNYNLLKKRIIMLHQKRSGTLARLRYLLAIPICGGLLCASTLAFSKTYGWVDIAPHRIDKLNTSPQVEEPVKRLLITKAGISTVTDKFSAKRADGSTRTYTAHNLSNKDKMDLKKQGVVVNILSDVKTDTVKTRIPPPPPPAPPVKRVKFPWPKPLPNKTAKGYLYSEVGYFEHGKQDVVVTFQEKDGSHKEYDKNKATAADLALLKEKYGYVFRPQLHLPPPPPPARPGKPASIRKRPPPPPPAPPAKTTYTKKGYKYTEDGYLVDGKTDFKVIIYEKNGDQKSYLKSQATAADIKTLNDKYGYSFPVMNIYTKMPPPPPMPRAPRVPRPKVTGFAPPVKTRNTDDHADQVSPASSTVTRHAAAGVRFNPPVNSGDSIANVHKLPVIIINGEIYKINQPIKRGQGLMIDAKGGASVVQYNESELPDAIKKYGQNARNGVVFAEGETKVYVK